MRSRLKACTLCRSINLLTCQLQMRLVLQSVLFVQKHLEGAKRISAVCCDEVYELPRVEHQAAQAVKLHLKQLVVLWQRTQASVAARTETESHGVPAPMSSSADQWSERATEAVCGEHLQSGQ